MHIRSPSRMATSGGSPHSWPSRSYQKVREAEEKVYNDSDKHGELRTITSRSRARHMIIDQRQDRGGSSCAASSRAPSAIRKGTASRP